MSIVQNEEFLRKECKNVSIFEGYNIIASLEEALQNSKIPGIGLAANQIGVDAKVCIIRSQQDKIDLINPRIVQAFDLMEFHQEGCLSFPNEWLKTKRYNEVVVVDDTHPAGIICTGITAVVVQHEVGHLYGEVMHDYKIKIPGANLPCWCKSNKKYKKCHMGKIIK